jgi:hypothetical protein
MEGTFVLRIELGNDAMQTPADVYGALSDMAYRVLAPNELTEWIVTEGKITDYNGNTIGEWKIQ